jgi:hypothetical protein
VLYFRVNFARVEALVGRLQALMVREEERRAAHGLTTAAAVSGGRPTLTSGNPLMSAGTFDEDDDAGDANNNTGQTSSGRHSTDDTASCETKASSDNSWFHVRSSSRSSSVQRDTSSESVGSNSSRSAPPSRPGASSAAAGVPQSNESADDATPPRPLRHVPEVLPSKSRILDLDHMADLEEALPDRCRGYTWRRVYDFEAHGVSLETLLERVSDVSECLLCVQATDGSVVGAFASEKLSKCHSASFIGTGETFVFAIKPDLQVFHWTGENELYVSASAKHLGFGGGGAGFALMLDSGKEDELCAVLDLGCARCMCMQCLTVSLLL